MPSTPEMLMRARYCAYTRADIAYIMKTMKGAALEGFNPVEAKAWAKASDWQGLEVVRAWNESETKGYVGVHCALSFEWEPSGYP